MSKLKISILTLFAISIGVMMVFSKCKKSTYNKLTEEEVLWMVYDAEEIMTFQSTLGPATQQMRIRAKNGGYRRDGETYNEFALAQIVLVGDTAFTHPNDMEGDLLLKKIGESFTVYLTWPHFPLETELTTLPLITANIKGTIYNDIIYIDGSAFSSPRFYVKILWYSKAYGVVQYEDVFGRKFYRKS